MQLQKNCPGIFILNVKTSYNRLQLVKLSLLISSLAGDGDHVTDQVNMVVVAVPQNGKGKLPEATEEGVAYVTQQDVSARGVHFLIFNT